MQKKIISIILSFSIVLLCVAPCFAIENTTGSAIKSLNNLNDTKATSPSTTVEPEDSSATRYYVNSNGNVSSSSTSINTWGNIVNDLTYSIAYSIGEVVKRLTTINNNVVNYLFSNASTGYYLWDWTTSGGVYQGAPTSSQSVISQLRAMGSSITKMLSYNTEYAYQLYSLISNGGILDTVKIDDNTNNGFSQSYLWKRYENGSVGSFTSYRQLADGTSSSSTWGLTNHSAMETIGYILTRFDNSLFQFASGMIKNWQNADVYLYNSDLTSYKMGTSGNSFWYDFRRFASNASEHLARLDYVLASDEEIEARQAAEANQESVIDNFIKSSGSGSASASDFADVATAGSSVKNALDSNVSAGNAFTSLSSDSPAWGWFSQSTADSLDSTSSGNRKSAGSDTPYLDRYYFDLMETLKLK